ncbi:uncharacterized protein B0J16DRAFT_331744 [Fusarium flagelliforme]|uniref:uncharacterized protein n=1 Tax=Fusarium flagelliforme TaxID=2675880 RepID=UPI001E8E6412|nr:uncharacterized protein B0J16DRAFT_331744 [Fusarium flagelliforme]KAH7191766.1 hypothetical protein B0J16DRAFT_331744 [Fusarium flagelliforme]
MGLYQSSRRALLISCILGFTTFFLCTYLLFLSNPPSTTNIITPTITSQPAQPAKPQITDFVKRNCHKKLREEHKRNGTDAQDEALASTLAELWKPLVHPIEERVFVTDKGERFEVPEGQMRWRRPLGKKVVLIDTDTRLDASHENTLLNECPPYYPTILGRTAGHLNHYLYAMIHGYDYRLVKAAGYPDRHGTWIKPAIAKEALKSYDFVVSLDSDAVFTHLDLPLEWLMNLWDVRPETLVAMAYDLDIKADYDSHNNLILNTGFVISQASKRTQELYSRWEDCPRSIPGCEAWNLKWAHEQSAFSYYIRYEFNGTHEVKGIPCNHANGNEFAHEGNCECQGVFVSHNWHTKHKVPELLSRSVMTAMARRVHGQFQKYIEVLFTDVSNATYPLKDITI